MLLADRSIAITSINYKVAKGQFLSGLQLEYSDGNKTPFFEKEGFNSESHYSINAEDLSSASKVAMAVMQDGGIGGLRLYDSDRKRFVDKVWAKDTSKVTWENFDVPNGKKIIGFNASLRGGIIKRLAFTVF